MGAEVQLLLLNGKFYWNSVNDILLGPIFDADETETEIDVLALNHPLCVGTLVHDINLGDNTDRPDTLLIDFPCHLKTV